jgi:hypothetical protein
MKSITKNLLIFAAGLIILTILFRFGLSEMLKSKNFAIVMVISSLYGLLVFIIGWIFGKKDYETLPLYDIGFRFHFATYLVCNLIAEAWFYFGLQSQYENVKTIHLTAILWGIGLIIHFIFFVITRKHAINGIKKTEIFD